MFDDGPFPASCVAEASATVLAIPKAAVQQLASRNHAFLWNAVRILALRLRMQAKLVQEISLQTVDQRLARFLYSEASTDMESDSGRAAFVFRYKVHEIASRLGSVREVVSRAMTRLEKKGLVERRRGSLVIHDLANLQAFAEQSPVRNRRPVAASSRSPANVADAGTGASGTATH
jgi:CRP-like cAMP-binding protein